MPETMSFNLPNTPSPRHAPAMLRETRLRKKAVFFFLKTLDGHCLPRSQRFLQPDFNGLFRFCAVCKPCLLLVPPRSNARRGFAAKNNKAASPQTACCLLIIAPAY